MEDLARLLRDTGQLDEALTLLERLRDLRLRLSGPGSKEALNATMILAAVLLRKGDLDGAEVAFRNVYQERAKLLGATHPDTAAALASLGTVLLRLGRLTEAEDALRSALAAQERSPSTRLGALMTRNSLASVLREQGKLDAAIELSASVVREAQAFKAGDPVLMAKFRGVHGRCLLAKGLHAEAEPHLLQTKLEFDNLPGQDAERAIAIRELIKLYDAWGKPEKAAEYRAMLPPRDPATPATPEQP